MNRTAEVETDCANCGKVIIRQRRQIETTENSFCSPSCQSDFKRGERTEVTCAECGHVEGRPPSQVSDGKNFCDRECMNRHIRKRPAGFSLEPYPSWNTSDNSVAVHQLIAVANGENPEDVFSNGEYTVHHENGGKLDNRHGNIKLLGSSEHGEIDSEKRNPGYSHTEVLSLTAFMLNPANYL